MINIIVHGFMGKMGQVICRMIKDDPDLSIACGVDINAGEGETFPVFKSFKDVNVKADVIIDFSTAQAVPELIERAVNSNLPVVLCTTGLTEGDISKVREAAITIPVFRSANMSLGINILAALIRKAAPALSQAGFDIEILEKHHNLKIDAPSGTAVLLADAVNESLGNEYSYIYDRSVKRERRSKKEIGIHSLRGGNVVGEHSVLFLGPDEVIELTHAAHSKEVFASGAVSAAKFLYNQPPGMYDMGDLVKSI